MFKKAFFSALAITTVLAGCAASTEEGEGTDGSEGTEEPTGQAESASTRCAEEQQYQRKNTHLCKINTPGSPISGTGNFLCRRRVCYDANGRVTSRGAWGNCTLVNCVRGTVCGDALC